MRQIKNVVFDFGGVIIDIDRDRAVKKFVEIGVKDADNLLDKYHQKGIFLEIEDGRIDAESFRLKLSEICGKELTYKEVELGWRGFVTSVEQYKWIIKNYMIREMDGMREKITKGDRMDSIIKDSSSRIRRTSKYT